MKKAVQFGAGNIGRGFLAELFSMSGYETVFIELNDRLVGEINKRKKYKLKIVKEKPKYITIKSIRAVNARDFDGVSDEIKSCSVIATAVGVNVLKNIAPYIAGGIKKRADGKIKEPLNIIICENLLEAGRMLKGHIKKHLEKKYFGYLDKKTGFVESVVSRMIPVVPEKISKKDPLFIMAEEYNILPVSRPGFVGKVPKIKGMLPKPNLIPYEEMKLFGHNLAHSILAYLGYEKGYKYIWQSIYDRQIRKITLDALYNEAGKALIKKHGISKKEYTEYIKDLIKRFENKALGDTVYRVGRDPVRKLGYNDRLIGSCRLCLSQRIVPANIVLGIISALKYNYKNDEYAVELQKMLKRKGLRGVLRKICGIDPKSKIGKLIKERY